ncbi:GNAT family N-acetyltransferase [Isachenkonia alkalipeptolytica]|nr:GNAT family N-acetyltransferase [Isachenkonia alkalipeptolytica]
MIVPGSPKDLHACCKILENSELGRIYFFDKDPGRMLSKALNNEEIYVVLDDQNNCIGFILFELKGTFGKYPYLHMIVVEREFRGKGIGRELIYYFENVIAAEYDKVFLLVGDFNKRAKELYRQLGYEEIGILSDFYRKGVNEYLMGKYKK